MYLKTELYELIRTDKSIFDFILESALDGLWYWDLENPENEWMNAKFWTVLGYNPDEMPHKSTAWQAVINKEDLEVVMENFTKHCQNPNHSYDQVVRYTHKNGSTVWIRCRGFAIRDENGKPTRMLGTHHDITELKEADEKHALSERTYKEIFNGIDDSLFIHEIGTGAILDVNDSMLKNFGYDRDDIPRLTLADLSAPKEPYTNEHIGELIKKASKGETVVFEWLCRRKNGDLFYSEIILKRVSIAGVERIMAIVRDITEHKRAEEKLKTSDRIFKHSLDMLCIAGFDGYFKVLNPAWTKTLGWSNKELFSKPWVDFVHPDDRDNTKNVETVLVGGKEIYQFENRYMCKDGTIKWLSWNSFPYHEDNIMFGVARDVTVSKQAKQELLQAKEKAEESDRLKSAFLANMSHEIRTPMNGILGFSELLKKPNLSDEKQQKYIGIIEKSGARMLNIINDLVDISKIEAGLMQLNMKESSINEQIDSVYAFFKPEADAKKIKLSCKTPLPTREATIKTDHDKVFAILTNLVKNAIKFTDKGSIELGYSLKSGSEPKLLEFYVNDTGIGIPKDKQKAIFERFIQIDFDDKLARQGAGLGLAISRAYVEMLGGKIWVESEEDKGTTFYFTLPYNNEPVAETIDRQHEPSGRNNDIRKLKTLIVEDDELSALLLDEILKPYSKEILTARTGVEAVEQCRSNPDIDLILMDVRMPEMGGSEATQQIREFNNEVIIIAQTAYGLMGDREKSIESGCNDYIAKPIKKIELQAMMQKYFGK